MERDPGGDHCFEMEQKKLQRDLQDALNPDKGPDRAHVQEVSDEEDKVMMEGESRYAGLQDQLQQQQQQQQVQLAMQGQVIQLMRMSTRHGDGGGSPRRCQRWSWRFHKL